MKYTCLKSYDPASIFRPAVENMLTERGLNLHHAAPALGAVMVCGTLSDGTTVYFDVRIWLERTLPVISQIRSDMIHADELLDYFFYSNTDIHIELPGISSKIVDLNYFDKNSEPYFRWSLAYDAGFSFVWMDSIPPACIQEARQYSKNALHPELPFVMQFIIGESELSARYLPRLQVGDVLLVNKSLNNVVVNNQIISLFSQTQEGFMLEQLEHANEDKATFPPFNPQLTGAKKIPVSLHFVIHETTMTLEKLNDFKQGDVIVCSNAENQAICIYANGVLLARGELVMVEDQLGVEIKALS